MLPFPCSFGNSCLAIVCTMACSRADGQTPVTKIHTGPCIHALPLGTLLSKAHSLHDCEDLLFRQSPQESSQVFTIRLLWPCHPLCCPQATHASVQQTLSPAKRSAVPWHLEALVSACAVPSAWNAFICSPLFSTAPVSTIL